MPSLAIALERHAPDGETPVLDLVQSGGLIAVIASLPLTANYSFLLFHTLIELFRIVVLGGIFVLAWHSRRWRANNFLLIVGIGAILFAVLSEFAFTRYGGVFDYANEVSHFLLLVSTYLLYRAMLVTGIAAPFDLLFRNLKQNEAKLEAQVGTSYSSLSYLKRFAVGKLKIDQSFVREMDRDADNATLEKTIVRMAHNLGLKTIAEGVEDANVAEHPRRLECDEAQGYHFARPMPADAFEAWVSARAAHEPGPAR